MNWLDQFLKMHQKNVENITLLAIDKNDKITMFHKN